MLLNWQKWACLTDTFLKGKISMKKSGNLIQKFTTKWEEKLETMRVQKTTSFFESLLQLQLNTLETAAEFFQ